LVKAAAVPLKGAPAVAFQLTAVAGGGAGFTPGVPSAGWKV
jgi:hypothetical protein